MPSLFGRRQLLASLAERWPGARRGRGTLVLVVAEPRMGASALLTATAGLLRAEGAPSPWGGPDDEPPRPLPSLAALVQATFEELSPQLRLRCEEARRRLAPLVEPRPAPLGSSTAWPVDAVTPVAATDAARRLWSLGRPLHGLCEALVEVLSLATAHRPQVWLLDDLETLAAASATTELTVEAVEELLAYLLLATGELPILALGSLSVRRDGSLPPGPLSELLTMAAPPSHVMRTELGPLDLASVRSWLTEELGAQRAEQLTAVAYAQTGGHPARLQRWLADATDATTANELMGSMPTASPEQADDTPAPSTPHPEPEAPPPTGARPAAALWEPTVRGALARRAGRTDEARTQLEQALGALQAIETDLATVANRGIRAQLLAVRGLTLAELGQLPNDPAAARRLTDAVVVLTDSGLIEPVAEAHHALGALAYLDGQWERAATAWRRSIRMALCLRMRPLELQGRLRLARLVLAEAAGLDEAAADGFWRRLGQLGELPELEDSRAGVLLALAEHELNGGRPIRATELLTAAQPLVERERPRPGELASATHARLRCELHLGRGQPQAALDLALDVLRDVQRSGTPHDTALLFLAAATALRQMDDRESALWFLREGKQVAQGAGGAYALARLGLEEALVYSTAGERPTALELLAAAAAQLERLGARREQQRAASLHRQLVADVTPRPLALTVNPVDRVREDSDELPRRITPPVDGSPSPLAASAPLPPGEERAVVDVARATAWIFSVDQLVDVVLDKALQLTRFQRGLVLLLDDQRHPIVRRWRLATPTPWVADATTATDELPSPAAEPSPSTNFSSSTVRRVIESGQALAVMDVDDDPALRAQESILQLRLRAVMCVPMRLAGRIIGIVYVDTRQVERNQDFPELVLLEALAGQAAISIEHARLLADEQRRNEHMNVVAHELRNPLSAILAFSEQFARTTAPLSPTTTADAFARIYRQGKRLSRLVDNLLELSRMHSAAVEWTMGPVAIEGILGELLQLYTPLAEKRKIALGTQLADGLPPACGNADRLMQVLMNLVGNALKFTPAGGTITLSARAERLPGPPQATTWLRVDVTDTGCGIDPELVDRLFHKFVRGGERRRPRDGVSEPSATGEFVVSEQGAGLGLYISREIILRHGGTIWVEPGRTQGAQLAFRLPTAAPDGISKR